MRYYDFKGNWQTIFVPILDNERVKLAKRYIMKDIISFLTLETIHDMYRWKEDFPEEFKKLTNDEQLNAIDKLAWGKFSPCENPEDFLDDLPEHDRLLEEWKSISSDEYDDPNKLEHYFYYHQCQIIATFIWTLCKSVWPDREWVICDNQQHAWVIDKNDPEVIYDFLYQYVAKSDADDRNMPNVKMSSHPTLYYPKLMIICVDITKDKNDMADYIQSYYQRLGCPMTKEGCLGIVEQVEDFKDHFGRDFVLDDEYLSFIKELEL